ncbi:MAG: 50S ribosomal protein L2 [Candidatus Aenigmarchaeota archaeon]|nr:50S ribosomal protein L2 [Candidatus Aenigmarchaeota archaeon]
MGKNLRQQRRGKGNTKYLSPSHRFIGKIRYSGLNENKEGKIVDIVHSSGKHTPVAIAEFQGKQELVIPSEGTFVGQKITYGSDVQNGNIVNIGAVPEGTRIFNIELRPGDGGKLCRAPGSAATLAIKGVDKCVVELPSRKQVTINSNCRATVGIPAGYGRQEKPFMKAGNKYTAMKALGKMYPTVRAVAKNAVDHPFGGKTRPGKQKNVSRHTPPGRKVGMIAAKRSGKKNKG